jgi:hypothetical protein
MAPITADDKPVRGVPNTFLQELAEELKRHGFRRVRYYPPKNSKTRNCINIYDTMLPRAGATRYGLTFGRGAKVRAELFIDTGDRERNKRLFDALKKEQHAVEAEFSKSLSWEPLPDNEGSRIASYRDGSITDDDKTLQEIKTWAIERFLKFKQVFSRRLKQLGSLG